MSRVSGVQMVVRAASRRRLLLLILEQAAIPCAVALAGAAILLVLGTDILQWFWPALLAGAAGAYAAFRIRRHMLSPYRVAQLVDRRLGLHDSLSTAWFLLSQRNQSHSAAAEFQVKQAEELVTAVQPASVLPFAAGRRWLATAVLLVLSMSLFTVRYTKIEGLSLRPPLISVHAPEFLAVEKLFSPDSESLAAARRSNHSKATSRAGDAVDREGSGTSSASSSPAKPGSGAKPGINQNQRASASHATNAARPDTLPPSLFRRVKDALASLAANLRSTMGGKNSSQASEAQPAQTVPGSNSESSRQASGQHGPKEQTASAQKQGASLSSSQAASAKSTQALSGIGHHNGDKDLRQAQDLAAMGKLTEILGKRSADLTGDMTVQSVAGTAALQTPDTGRLAQHQDFGGEIRRDVVPPMYRDYVERYMEEVHRNSTPSTQLGNPEQ